MSVTETDVPVYLRLDPRKCVVRSYSVAGGAGKRPRLKLELEVDPDELGWMLRDLEEVQEKARAKAAPSKKQVRRPDRAIAHRPLLQITHVKGCDEE